MNAIKITKSLFEHHSEFVKANAAITALALIFFARTIYLGLVPSASDILTVWPIFEFGKVPIQNSLLSDVVVQSEPWILFNILNIHNFQLPLWNPYCAGGVPHFANNFFSPFFFLGWPLYIIGISKYTLLLFYFGKIYLAGICCYCYLRSIGPRFYPALIGSVAYMFIGFNVVWLYYPPSNLVFILPAMLYLIEKVVVSQFNEKHLLALSFLTASGIFAGFPVTFFHIIVVSAVYFTFRLIYSARQNKALLLKKYALFSMLGVALSGVQLLPFLEYLLNSSAWTANQGCVLDWHAAILNLQPEFYGSPSIYQMIPYYVQFTNYNESASGYVGIAMICLAVFAVITKFKDGMVRFFFILGIWAIGVVYGLPGIFYLTTSLPLFSKADNLRLLFLIGFSVVVLGTLGLNQITDWSERDEKGRITHFFVVSTFLVLAALFYLAWANKSFLFTLSTLNLAKFNDKIALAQTILVSCTTILVLSIFILIYIYVKYNSSPRHRKVSLILLFLLVFAETGFHGMLFEPSVDEKYFHPKVEAFDWISSKHDLYRTTSITAAGSMSVYPVNTQMTYGIYDIRNYDVLENKYYWTLFNKFSEGMMSGYINLVKVDERFLDFMGVRWIFSDRDLNEEEDVRAPYNTDPIGELAKGFIVDQEFLSKKNNLSGVDLLLGTYGRKGVKSNVTISLMDKKSNIVIRTVRIDTRAIEDNKWYNVEFTPVGNSSNESYIMDIKGDGNPGKSITLWMNKFQASGSEGDRLSVNGNAINGTICYNLYYRSTQEFKLIYKNLNYSLFENSAAFPRAFIVRRASFENDDPKILKSLEDPLNDWRSYVILHGEGRDITYPEGRSDANISKYDSDYVRINVNTEHPGFLVLSDAYYPGWNAYINGSKVDIFRANYAFRAVEVPGGKSILEFRYEPMSLYMGIALTAFSLLILASILIRKRISLRN